MKPSRRVLLWGSGLLVLFLVAVGSWFFRTYFTSTNEAIRHAEAFLFRRMAVAQLAEQGEYRFFYATNRSAGEDQTVIGQRFGSDRQEQVNFGSFDATVTLSLANC